jgi:CubicO group peptidase (beta-lactamase class C family)
MRRSFPPHVIQEGDHFMTDLQIEAEPKELGFDGERLARIDRHFARYVDDGLLAGWLIAVARQGRIVHIGTYGQRDVEAADPVELDTIWRIYSMTKPVTSIAAMMLYEEGAFELKDPISKWLPAFADTKVYRGGSALNPVLEAQQEPIRVWHLLTHTSGLTYGFHYSTPVDAMYRASGFEWGAPPGDNAAMCDAWASLPLLFQPGSEWNYGVSTDVLGHLVELISGESLDDFFRTRIFEPLGMSQTGFHVEPSAHSRLAALYVPTPDRSGILRADVLGDIIKEKPEVLSGGGGLASTASDYHRFCQMLLNGGEHEGIRLLGTRTLRYMTRNHLPGGVDLESFGRPTFAETTFEGVGFGLGFSVVESSVDNKVMSSVGDFGWGGAASTAFWVDPTEEITALFFTQLLPSTTYPLRSQLKQLVYQALID